MSGRAQTVCLILSVVALATPGPLHCIIVPASIYWNPSLPCRDAKVAIGANLEAVAAASGMSAAALAHELDHDNDIG